MENEKLIEFLLQEGYFNLKEIPERGMCGLYRFIYTVGLCYGLDKDSYKGRYCFENLSDAKESLDNWDGISDPLSNWIKHKGNKEYSNSHHQ